jgi:hypothetical protein
MPKFPMLTEKALDTAADHVWPLDDLSDQGREDLRRDTSNGLRAFLAAQDREALAALVNRTLDKWEVHGRGTAGRAVIDALFGDA